jgi:hypothetical protein
MSQNDVDYELEQSIVPLSTSVSLEVDLIKPTLSRTNDNRKLAICLHPWSWLGGRKDDPCVQGNRA